jgi:hypothetical protein
MYNELNRVNLTFCHIKILIFIYANLQIACTIHKNSPDVINDLMANLKVGKGNSMDNIGFHIPLSILQKHSSNTKHSLLTNIISSRDMTTSEMNPQIVLIHLNKSNFINDMLKDDEIQIPQPCMQNFKPRIIEFR